MDELKLPGVQKCHVLRRPTRHSKFTASQLRLIRETADRHGLINAMLEGGVFGEVWGRYPNGTPVDVLTLIEPGELEKLAQGDGIEPPSS